MLTKEENEYLTRVGKGTPGGELMRRYWHPVYPEALLREAGVVKARILGEDLVLYRDRSGNFGLIGPRCPHRGTSLALGIPEAEGRRCCYHGWRFNGEGRCIEQPLEPPDSTFKDKIRIPGYPVQALGGLIWAYLGPLPAPVLPRWDLFVRESGFRQIVAHRLPCNWLQAMENRGDLGHAVYLHGRLFQYALEKQGRLTDDPEARYNATMTQQARDLERGVYTHYRPIYNEFGFTKGRRDSTQPEDIRAWTIGINPILFPYLLAQGPGDTGIRRSYQFGVPIDDTTTWHMQYFCYQFPGEVDVPKQDVVPYAEVPLTGEDGQYQLDYVLAQDMVAWYEQGEIVDRTQEHLGTSDTLVIAYRRMLKEQIALVEAGKEPMNVFRNAAAAESPELRIAGSEGAAPSLAAFGAQVDYRGNFHKVSKGGWRYIDDDADRYCPDRDLIVELFAKTAALTKAGS
jgi:5,5'-dehydrodivanillate O-demethylase oxygenase subunit